VLDIKGSSGLDSIVYEDYEDTNGLRAGVELSANDNVTLRAGFTKNSAGAPDQTVTPNLPEAPRETYSGGLGFKLGSHAVSNLYFMYLNQGKRDGRTSDCGVARPTAACNNGVYSFNAYLFGAGLTFVF
jgi:long-chain fatty acid transport protein